MVKLKNQFIYLAENFNNEKNKSQKMQKHRYTKSANAKQDNSLQQAKKLLDAKCVRVCKVALVQQFEEHF